MPEFELLDTGIFDEDRYWDITVDYAKATPDDIVHASLGPQRRPRDGDARTCCRRCGSATRGRGASTTAARASPRRTARSSPSTTRSGAWCSPATASPSSCSATTSRTRSACGAATGRPLSRRTASAITSSHGPPTVNPDADGTKAALWYRLDRRAGRRQRAHRCASAPTAPGATATMQPRCSTAREREADEFYAALTPAGADRRGGDR